jgi:hypothetical protein
MIDALRTIAPADRAAAIDEAARHFSRQALVIEALGIAMFILGFVVVWSALP